MHPVVCFPVGGEIWLVSALSQPRLFVGGQWRRLQLDGRKNGPGHMSGWLHTIPSATFPEFGLALGALPTRGYTTWKQTWAAMERGVGLRRLYGLQGGPLVLHDPAAPRGAALMMSALDNFKDTVTTVCGEGM